VATGSLELGIDVGSIDLVCQVESPKSIAAAVQRIGRSGHHLGKTPKGRIFALTLDDLLECAAIVRAIREKDRKKILHTIEFFPEEGKYHFDGHRACDLVLAPEESKKLNKVCPRCGKKLTIGVLHRVDDLADRQEGHLPKDTIPFKNMIPLDEIVADALGQSVGTKGVEQEYEKIVKNIGPEISILFDRTEEELSAVTFPRIVEGILKVRDRQVEISPGYDGVYGKIKIFREDEKKESASSSRQMELF